ncbi:hypothetical protein [Methylorubrum zatmanii]|uniref:Uncharacterized protein n=1 Tax=Methylorubrum zatmanii TaxID=29429 RepID=A0ABW1WU39_9HYPH|nr:hypothetical protein [Methylorubrum zatmanii]MBD8905941.1 hypothetical protein [Methylorubrum zatmanii]
MIELRPQPALAEAPLVLVSRQSRPVDASVRPLMRGAAVAAVLAAALALPAVADLVTGLRRPDATPLATTVFPATETARALALREAVR